MGCRVALDVREIAPVELHTHESVTERVSAKKIRGKTVIRNPKQELTLGKADALVRPQISPDGASGAPSLPRAGRLRLYDALVILITFFCAGRGKWG